MSRERTLRDRVLDAIFGPPRAVERRNSTNVDGGLLIFGTLLGLLCGGITALLNVPQSGRELRARISGLFSGVRQSSPVWPGRPVPIPRDPVQRSIDEGKEAARRLNVERG